jgi:uncharacterized membrane protein
MNKTKLLAAAFAAAALSVSISYASEHEGNMEKCKAVDSKGVNIIKEHMSDCSSKTSSCAGHNKAGDSDAWILVPKGDCEKINKGNFSGISKEIKDKLDLNKDK